MDLIAIVDDDKDIVETTGLILQANGFDVVKAYEPGEAYNLIKERKPDLIILDVMMNEPDDGFFLAQRLRREGIETPILMYTSISKAIGMEFGKSEIVSVDDFVEKPISSDELLTKVKKLLNIEGE